MQVRHIPENVGLHQRLTNSIHQPHSNSSYSNHDKPLHIETSNIKRVCSAYY